MHEFQPNFSLSVFKIGHLFSRKVNYNISSLLRIRVGTHIIYLSIYWTSVTYQKMDSPQTTSGGHLTVSGDRCTVRSGRPRPHPTSVGRTLIMRSTIPG